MADYTNTAEMNLPVPVVGTAPGPEWASLLNSCLTIIDTHSHVPGSGVPITPSAININADLTFGGFNGIAFRTVRFSPQSAALALASDLGCLYEVANDLYYNDGAGNQIRLTQSGSIVGTAGSITGLPSGTASAAYTGIGATFVWQSATGIAASMDFGSAVLRNTSPNSTYALTLSPPAALAANYALTLPASTLATNLMTLDSSGQMAAVTNVDGTSIVISSNTIKVPDGGVTPAKLSAVNYSLSSSCGAFTTIATGATDVTNLTGTVTASGVRPVQLLMQADGSSNPCELSFTGIGSGFYIQFVKDGTFIAKHFPPYNGGNSTVNGWQPNFIDFPSAGSHTYKVQVVESAASGIIVKYYKLLVLEL